MSRHYWPGPPTSSTQYLVEHENGEVHRLTLDIDNEWSGDSFRELSRGKLIRRGYLGVRTPFSEEAERAAFEAAYKMLFPNVHQPKFSGGMYGDYDHRVACRIWLAAKRHERGL